MEDLHISPSTGKKHKSKCPQDILELPAPITNLIQQPRTDLYHRAPQGSLSPTATDNSDYNRSQQSNDSAHSFQSKSSGYASGYATDDNSPEGQLLSRATRSNPACVIMSVVKDYEACCAEEISVKKGQRIKVLYRQGDWAFSQTKQGEKGFVPYSFIRVSRKYGSSGYASEGEGCRRGRSCGYETDPGYRTRPSRSHADGTSIASGFTTYERRGGRRNARFETPNTDIASGYVSEYSRSQRYGYSSAPRHHKSSYCLSPNVGPSSYSHFRCSFIEELVVIHDFNASDENEVMVTKGEQVKVLNAEDPEWLWISTVPGDEGYVPRCCLSFGTHPALQKMTGPPVSKPPARRPDRSSRQLPHHLKGRSMSSSRAQREFAKAQFRQLALAQRNPSRNPVLQDKEEIQKIGTRLLVLSNYDAVEEDELQVELGEVVLADVLTQSNVKKVWAYCPRTNKVGYLPVWVVHPPVI